MKNIKCYRVLYNCVWETYETGETKLMSHATQILSIISHVYNIPINLHKSM